MVIAACEQSSYAVALMGTAPPSMLLQRDVPRERRSGQRLSVHYLVQGPRPHTALPAILQAA